MIAAKVHARDLLQDVLRRRVVPELLAQRSRKWSARSG